MTELDVRDLLLSVTNFCLGSCVYCNIRLLKIFNFDAETSVKDIERLLEDPLLDGLQNMHVTGGEPVLSPKTYEVFKLIKKLHPDIRINTPLSGFFPQTTFRYLRKLWELTPQLRVDVSLDGPEDIHAKTRGEGSFKQVMASIELLRKIAPAGKLQIGFTIMPSNYKYIRWTYELAKSMDMGFYASLPHWSTRFGHEEDGAFKFDQTIIDEIDKQMCETWVKERPLNKRIWTEQKAFWEGKRLSFDCDMGKYSLDVDPFGNVYPCMVYLKEQIFGNIRHETLTSMFRGAGKPRTEAIFKDIANHSCKPCLMPCCAWKRNLTVDGKVFET